MRETWQENGLDGIGLAVWGAWVQADLAMGPAGASGTPSPLVRKEKDNPAGICRGGIHANGTAGGTFLVLSLS